MVGDHVSSPVVPLGKKKHESGTNLWVLKPSAEEVAVPNCSGLYIDE